MTRRERLPGRRPATREPRRRLLIVCGAEKTEKAYFVGIRDARRQIAVDVTLAERPRSPDQVVAYARDHCDYRDFDEAWCVVDVDRFEIDGRKVTAACIAAGAAGIRTAVSNPCFEYWLLLHHEQSAALMPNCGQVAARIRRFVPSYDKARLRFSDFEVGVVDAVKRAKQDDRNTDWGRNPSTTVWQLVERLLEGM